MLLLSVLRTDSTYENIDRHVQAMMAPTQSISFSNLDVMFDFLGCTGIILSPEIEIKRRIDPVI